MKNTKIILILILLSISLFFINSDLYPLDYKVLTRIDETYDDNIKATSENKEDDYITNLMLGLNLHHESLTQTFDFIGHIYQQLFLKNNNLNYNSQDLVINYDKQLSSRDNIHINNIFNNYPEPQDFSSSFGRPSGRYAYYLNNFNIASINALTENIISNIHYNNIVVKSTNNRQLNDSISNNAGASFGLTLDPSNIVFLYYDYTNRRYKKFDEITDQKKYNIYIIHDAELGYQHFITKTLDILGKFGLEYVIAPDEKNYYPIFNILLTDLIDKNNTLKLSIEKKHELSQLSDAMYESWIFSIIFKRQLSDLLSISLNALYDDGKSKSASWDSRRKLFGLTTSISYYLSEQTYITTTYTYTKNYYKVYDLNATEFNYNRNQIRIGLTSEF